MRKSKMLFDVKEVDLKGKNLVEASAGTGKTFSIAILVLRLLIEKNIPIDKQLIVTFTKFAVAELQERIRKFIKEADEIVRQLESGREPQNADATILFICKKAWEVEKDKETKDKDKLKNRLRQALLTLDEANVLTIHSFCQKMLNEFAFETKQSFQAELQSNVDEFIQQTLNDFWRKELTNFPEGIFSLEEFKEIKTGVKNILQKGLNNIKFEVSELYKDLNAEGSAYEGYRKIEKENEESLAEIYEYIQTSEALKVSIEQAGAAAKKAYGDLFDQPEAFLNKCKAGIKNGSSPMYLEKFDCEFKRMVQELPEYDFKIPFYLKASQIYLPKLQSQLQQSGVLTFDALILNLYKAVVEQKNEKLTKLISQRFPVVMIDEFQDTDIVQFELFRALFIENNHTILFLIGDPKQSIYAFRGADVDSYLTAAKKMEQQYSMNTNYRSGEGMIKAVEHFFNASGDFAFGYESGEIRYEEVDAASKNKTKTLTKAGESFPNLVFSPSKNKTDALEALSQTIASLLNQENKYRLVDGDQSRVIAPKDITVLVNENEIIDKIKKLLQSYNIPVVGIRDSKILATQEAKDISLILQAMLEPKLQNIKSALFLTFIQEIYQLQHEETLMPLLQLDELKMAELFKKYCLTLESFNVYQALMQLFNDFSMQQLLSKEVRNQSKMSNLLQLAEVLHQEQSKKKYSAEETLQWLKRQIDNPDEDSSEYQQRMESDEEAVRIMTIHKSKGLEFPIVFVYGVHGKEKDRSNKGLVDLKNKEGIKVIKSGMDINDDEKQKYLNSGNQEIRRKIYVALTRPVYQCFVFYSNSSNTFKNSPLESLLTQCSNENGVNKNFIIEEEEYEGFKYRTSKQEKLSSISLNLEEIEKAKNSKTLWFTYSFSSLSAPHAGERPEENLELQSYDQFVFNELPKGAQVGTKLHELFENINFKKDFLNLDLLTEKEKKYLSGLNTKDQDFTASIAQMLHHVLNARIDFGAPATFYLKDVEINRKKHELEFYFPVSQKEVSIKMNNLLKAYQIEVPYRFQQIEGLMMGFIDLLFEQNGKYYILDWKSNYLGFQLEAYEGANLNKAMEQHQYNLQYLIYTVAVQKFLRQILGTTYDYDKHFGGVIYVFLRGARAGKQSGIFTDKPNKELIEELELLLDKNMVLE